MKVRTFFKIIKYHCIIVLTFSWLWARRDLHGHLLCSVEIVKTCCNTAKIQEKWNKNPDSEQRFCKYVFFFFENTTSRNKIRNNWMTLGCAKECEPVLTAFTMNYINMWQKISNIKRNTITYIITILIYTKTSKVYITLISAVTIILTIFVHFEIE